MRGIKKTFMNRPRARVASRAEVRSGVLVSDSGQAGYTLIEVVVALGIFVAIAAIATGVFTSVVRVQRGTLGIQNAEQEMRRFQDLFSRDVRAASTIDCNGGSGSVTITGANDTMHYSVALGDDGRIQRDGIDLVTLPIEGAAIQCSSSSGAGGADLVTMMVVVDGVASPYQITVSPRLAVDINE